MAERELAKELVSKVQSGEFENSNFWNNFCAWSKSLPGISDSLHMGKEISNEITNVLLRNFLKDIESKKQEFYTGSLKHLPDNQELKGFNEKLAKLVPEAFYDELTKQLPENKILRKFKEHLDKVNEEVE